jgi:hypothetical protein
LVYVLLTNKTQATYEKLFTVIQNHSSRPTPTTVISDFEIAARQAVVKVYPQVEMAGCFFHLGQSVWRKVQAGGLQQQYSNDAELSLRIRMLPALSFVPPGDVENAFEALAAADFFPQEATSVLDYFEDTYIGRPQRRGPRRGALFKIPEWNSYDRVHQGVPRTNNALEGWHRAFQANVGAHHPSIWKFIVVLQREESAQRASVEQAAAGREPTKKKRKYIETNERLQRVVGDYSNRSYIDYLRGIAYNIQLNV